MPATYTPIRYPGGKSCLYSLMLEIMQTNKLQVECYVEAFAGGAGLAIKLLLLDKVKSVVLNDLDPAVACFWLCVTENSDELINFVHDVEITLEEWQIQKNTYSRLRSKALSKYESLDEAKRLAAMPIDSLSLEEKKMLACAFFYLNRTNRSGIMAGGPIGGKKQNGSYKIDARFNKENLIAKIKKIAECRRSISIYNYDAAHFIKNIIPQYCKSNPNGLLAYFDPPYVGKGPELYQNSLTEKDHKRLSQLITSCHFNWLVTYDECSLAKDLYNDFYINDLEIAYCAHRAKIGKEILVLGNNLKYR